MQDNYSLKLALLDEARGGLDDGDTNLGRLWQPGSLAGRSTLDTVQEPLSGVSLALANAGLQINGLILEQGLLRESLVSLNNTLSSQLALLEAREGSAAVGSTSEPGGKGDAPPGVKLEITFAGQNLLLNLINQQRDLETSTTRNVTSVINPGAVGLTPDGLDPGQSHDQASWTESSGTSLTLNARLLEVASTLERHAETTLSKTPTAAQAALPGPGASKPAAPENSVKANREAYEASKERLAHTLDTSASPLENAKFKALSWATDGANAFAEDSPQVAGTLKSVGATLGPIVGSVLGPVLDEAKTRVAGKALDAVATRMSKVGGKSKASRATRFLGGLLKGKDEGKDEGKKGGCCCPVEAKVASISSYGPKTPRKSTKPPGTRGKPGRAVNATRSAKPGKSQRIIDRSTGDPRQAKNLALGNAEAKSPAAASNNRIARRGPPSQSIGFAPPVAPAQSLAAIPRGAKTSVSRLTGTMAKLGSAGIRR